MKRVSIFWMFPLVVMVLGVCVSTGQTSRKAMAELAQIDEKIRTEETKLERLQAHSKWLAGAVEKAKTGKYYIIPAAEPVLISQFDGFVMEQFFDDLLERGAPSPLNIREYIKNVKGFTNWINEYGTGWHERTKEAIDKARQYLDELKRQRELILAQRDEQRSPSGTPQPMGVRWVRTDSKSDPEKKTAPEHRNIGGGYTIEEMSATKARIVNKSLQVESTVTADEPPGEFRGSFDFTMKVECKSGKADYCCAYANISCTVTYEPAAKFGKCGKGVDSTQTYTIKPPAEAMEFFLTPYVVEIGAMATYKYEKK